ncbi:MAG: bifunctional oligoribonuclease/PAP phosphatase NrnA [Candidatus Omnitrophica bacterium]|nr:bifunctional oligoribonuclease/PAP phosphatase NrnA [Candidatus Omnitrophota bacterium]
MKKVVEAIKKYRRFLVTAHVNLEGDSLGSQLAMKELLEGLGKKAYIIDNDPVPEHYKFLPGAHEVSNDLKAHVEFDAALILDCPTIKRIGQVKKVIGSKLIINIDHHVSNEKFGNINWVDARASSAGEMIYRLFKAMNRPLTKEAALYLYIAILTDTGSFNYDNTSSVTHEIVSELLGYGLDPALVSERVYERRSVSDIKLLGLALATLKVNKKGDVAYVEVTKKMLKEANAEAPKSEGFINYPRSINKVKVAILFKEGGKHKGDIDISFRSKGDVDVNKIASHFGGGGHMKASGCVIKGSLAGVKKRVLAKIEEMLRG